MHLLATIAIYTQRDHTNFGGTIPILHLTILPNLTIMVVASITVVISIYNIFTTTMNHML